MEQPGLWLLEAETAGLLVDNGRAAGIVTHLGQEIEADAVVLTTGTFLRGLVHVGLNQRPAGRLGDPPSNALSDNLKALGFNLRRLKTGTCPRLDRRSLDLAGLPIQAGDERPRLFSFLSDAPVLPQVGCWVTRTTQASHDLIRANLHQSPMYAGVITGVGARYCPSIEDKVVRFPERASHQVFLEPQGLTSQLVYPNGIPTSLPLRVQIELVRSLPGCERAHVARPGYAIEYDMSDPQDLTADLQSKRLRGLYLAGQINGTSGYEEAAAQGLVAGVNAALVSQGRPAFILDRAQAYIGVLIDDLVTKGTAEPYRMFTSRAEYRLSLREDNADLRLTPLGRELGLVDDARWGVFCTKREAIATAWERLEAVRVNPTPEIVARLAALGSAAPKRPLCAAELLRRPELGLVDLAALDPALEFLAGLPAEAALQVQIKARYLGYEERQREQVARFRSLERQAIPPDFSYAGLPGLSREAQEKLARLKPASLGQAGRISGITPAALMVLSLHLARASRPGAELGPA